MKAFCSVGEFSKLAFSAQYARLLPVPSPLSPPSGLPEHATAAPRSTPTPACPLLLSLPTATTPSSCHLTALILSPPKQERASVSLHHQLRLIFVVCTDISLSLNRDVDSPVISSLPTSIDTSPKHRAPTVTRLRYEDQLKALNTHIQPQDNNTSIHL